MGRVKPGWQGRFFEDFEVGDVYRCRYGRTVTEADNIAFTLLTNNTNQLHFNTDYAARTEWGRCLVNNMLTLAIVTGMGSADVSEHGFALGWDEITLPGPVFAGDTLYSESEVTELRESASRPGQGIVTVETRGYKQDGSLVIRYRRSVMVWKRGHGPAGSLFPADRRRSAAAEAPELEPGPTQQREHQPERQRDDVQDQPEHHHDGGDDG